MSKKIGKRIREIDLDKRSRKKQFSKINFKNVDQ